MSDVAAPGNATIRKDLTVEHIDDNVVVLDRKNGRIHQLNQTASIVWQGLAAGMGWRTIAASLTDRFEVSLDDASDDVTNLVEEFRTLQLLETELK